MRLEVNVTSATCVDIIGYLRTADAARNDSHFCDQYSTEIFAKSQDPFFVCGSEVATRANRVRDGKFGVSRLAGPISVINFFQVPEKMANRVHEPRNSSTVMKSTKALYRMNIRKKLIHEDIVAERSKAQD